MAQRSTHKGEQSKARLLAAARAIFAEQGYHATKISDIVARAGLTQAAFYLYFPGKEAVFDALIAEFHGALRQSVVAGRVPLGLDAAGFRAFMREHIHTMYTLLDADHNLTRIALFESDQAEVVRRALAAQLVENFAWEQQAGYLRADLELEVAAELTLGLVERAAVRWLLTGERRVDDLVEETVTFLMVGMYARAD